MWFIPKERKRISETRNVHRRNTTSPILPPINDSFDNINLVREKTSYSVEHCRKYHFLTRTSVEFSEDDQMVLDKSREDQWKDCIHTIDADIFCRIDPHGKRCKDFLKSRIKPKIEEKEDLISSRTINTGGELEFSTIVSVTPEEVPPSIHPTERMTEESMKSLISDGLRDRVKPTINLKVKDTKMSSPPAVRNVINPSIKSPGQVKKNRAIRFYSPQEFQASIKLMKNTNFSNDLLVTESIKEFVAFLHKNGEPTPPSILGY